MRITGIDAQAQWLEGECVRSSRRSAGGARRPRRLDCRDRPWAGHELGIMRPGSYAAIQFAGARSMKGLISQCQGAKATPMGV